MATFDDKTKVPGVNYYSQFSISDLDFEQTVYSEEFLQRMWLMFGGYSSTASYGIVDESDPKSILDSDTARPLQVQLDGDGVKVNPGMTVMQSGAILKLKKAVENVTFGDLSTACSFVVYVEYELQETSPALVAKYGDKTVPRLLQAPTSTQAVKVDLLTNFLDTVKYPDSRRKNITVLAIAEVVADCDGVTSITLKHTDSNYAWLRPWFSPVDHAHRAAKNPHNTTLNDLLVDTDSNSTLWNLVTRHGLIISSDESSPGQPGKLCEESLAHLGPAQILLDSTGAVTGKLNRLYADLTSYPVRLGRCVRVVDEEVENSVDWSRYSSLLPDDATISEVREAIGYFGLGVELVPHTNRILFSWDELQMVSGTTVVPDATWYQDEDINVRYTRVASLEPPIPSAVATKAKATFGALDTTRDHLIASGFNITEIESYEVDCADLAPLPAPVMVYAISSEGAKGKLVKTPHVLIPATKFSDVGATLTVEAELLGSSRIWVGFWGVNAGLDADGISITVTGTDPDGTGITKTATITAARVTAYPGLACVDSDLCAVEPTSADNGTVNGIDVQGRLTDWQKRFIDVGALFATVTSVSVSVHGNTVDAAASFYVVAVPFPALKNDSNMFGTTSSKLNGACPVAMLLWDGTRICGVRDYRPIAVEPTKLEGRVFSDIMLEAQANVTYPSFKQAGALSATEEVGWHLLMAEDLRSPWFTDLDKSRFNNQYTDGLDWYHPHAQAMSGQGDVPFIGQGIYVSRAVSVPQYLLPHEDGVTTVRSVHNYLILKLLGEQQLAKNMFLSDVVDSIIKSADLVQLKTAVPAHVQYLATTGPGGAASVRLVQFQRRRDYLWARIDAGGDELTYSATRVRVILNLSHLLDATSTAYSRIRGFMLFSAYDDGHFVNIA